MAKISKPQILSALAYSILPSLLFMCLFFITNVPTALTDFYSENRLYFDHATLRFLGYPILVTEPYWAFVAETIIDYLFALGIPFSIFLVLMYLGKIQT